MREEAVGGEWWEQPPLVGAEGAQTRSPRVLLALAAPNGHPHLTTHRADGQQSPRLPRSP